MKISSYTKFGDAETSGMDREKNDIELSELLKKIHKRVSKKNSIVRDRIQMLIDHPQLYGQDEAYQELFRILLRKISEGKIKGNLGLRIHRAFALLQRYSPTVSDQSSSGELNSVRGIDLRRSTPESMRIILDNDEGSDDDEIPLDACMRVAEYLQDSYFQNDTARSSFLLAQLTEVIQGQEISASIGNQVVAKLMEIICKTSEDEPVFVDLMVFVKKIQENMLPESSPNENSPLLKKPFQLSAKRSPFSEGEEINKIVDDEQSREDDEDHMGYFGKYKILKTLGQGTMGLVFLAIDPVTTRKVAIKVMHTINGHKDIKMFLREARALAQVKSPNCITIYDLTDIDGKACIISEYINGLNGKEFFKHQMFSGLNPQKALSPIAAALIGEQIMRGMRALHKAGFIHRDIKPENFMVDSKVIEKLEAMYQMQGSLSHEDIESVFRQFRHDPWIKINDLGLALYRRREGGLKGTESMFQSALVSCPGGTPLYMPPEVMKEQTITDKADVFAMGLLFYEMLTGQNAGEARKHAEKVDPKRHRQALAYVTQCSRSRAGNSISRRDPAFKLLLENAGDMKEDVALMIDFMRSLTKRNKDKRPDSRETEQLFDHLTIQLGLKEDQESLRISNAKRKALAGEIRKVNERNELYQVLLGLTLPSTALLLLILMIVLGYSSLSSPQETENEGAQKIKKNKASEQE